MLVSGLQLGVEIGAGCFGKVHLAIDPVHGEVAAKILHRDPTETAAHWIDRKDGLLHEAVLLREATHPHVVPVYQLLESDVDDSVLYVMQYCKKGCLLSAYERGPLPLNEVKQIATNVSLGLAALHAKDILHRDIKPSNILRFDSEFKISDFGLATDDMVLGYASAAGYTDHLAPEVLSTGLTSKKTDIWALGMTIYRLLHGKTWYESIGKPRNAVSAGRYAHRLQWLAHVPAEWRRFVRALLNDDPSLRLSALGVIDRLARLATSPSWDCVVKTDQVRWKASSGGRIIEVTWDRSTKSGVWAAISRPKKGASGQKKTLARLASAASPRSEVKKLETFFEERHGRG